MILHPHLDQFYEAIEVLRKVSVIMKVRGLQPSVIRRYLICNEEEGGVLINEYGYLHEIKSDNLDLEISWALYSDSEYGSLCIRAELTFGDNPEHLLISNFCMEYNVAKSEWVASYENMLDKESNLKSKRAEEFAGKYSMLLDTHRVLETQAAWSVVRDMAEFFSKYGANH